MPASKGEPSNPNAEVADVKADWQAFRTSVVVPARGLTSAHCFPNPIVAAIAEGMDAFMQEDEELMAEWGEGKLRADLEEKLQEAKDVNAVA